jgi:hypothetical protein
MRYTKIILVGLCLTGTIRAQSDDQASEDIVELSPFTVATEGEPAYKATAALAGTRIATQLVDPRSAAMPAPVAVSILRRADAVAVQFVLSNSGGKQEVRNQELYSSLEGIEAAFRKVPGMRVEQREVRFTGGNRKMFSVSSGESTMSFVSVLVLADLPPEGRVADRVKQVRDILASTKLVGLTKYSDGSVGLYVKNPDQYRREILQKVFDDVDFLKKGFGGEFEVQPNGLNGKVRMRVASEAEVELWIDYGILFRSIRELEAAKKK